ncbi:MAG TPA: PAS domain S-box protein, partial [Gallionella sp.]|nr:PAS domain S-box protein [Gallionella sp.]
MIQPNAIMRKQPLAKWLALGLALLALGGLIALNMYIEHERAAARERDRLSSQARVIAENMERQLASANLALESIRDDLPYWIGPVGSPSKTPRLKTLVNALQGISYIGIMDKSGIVQASNMPEIVGKDLAYRDYFQTVRQHPDAGTLYVSPPFKSLNGTYVINITRMLPDRRGEFTGIVTASLDPEYFKTLMASVLYAPDMWDAIGHGDGLLFVMMPAREGLHGMNLAQPGSFFSQHRDSGQVATVLSGLVYSTHEMRIMAQRTVRPTSLKMDKPLVVAISRDLDIVFQPWRRDTATQVILFGLITMVSIFGLYAYQRRQRTFEQQSAIAAAVVQQSAERLQLATEASGIGVWDFDIATGELVWDDSMYAIYKLDKTAASDLYKAWHNCVLPEDHPVAEAALRATIEQGVPYTLHFRIIRNDGELRYIQARARVYFDTQGKPARLVGINEDITERHHQETALQESEERFHSTFDAAAIGMALVSLEGRFMQANGALCRILGYTQTELQQKTFQDITHPDDLETDLALAKELLLGIRDSYQMEKRYFHKDGRVIWILLSGSAVRDQESKTLYFIAQIQDITERRTLLEQLELQAHQDYLTGLSNRRYFLERGEVELARVQRYGKALSLFMLDIDHFKNINDTHGHKTGDIVLQKLSGIMKDMLRTMDIIGRLGGEEFAVLLPETDLQEAAEVAERLREIVASTNVILDAGLPLRFTIS